MFTFTRISRFILVSTAALAIAAPAASAKPFVVAPGGPSVTYQGTYRPATDNVQLGPDRSDRIGTIGQASGIHALPVATKVTVTSNSFDWTAAAIGAGSVTAALLIGAGALGLRGRRRMALGV